MADDKPPMEYHLLTEDHKHEHVANFILAQEQDHYLHSINKKRYEDMLYCGGIPAGPFRERIERLHAETCDRLMEVEAILLSTRKAMPEPETLRAALVRLDQKRTRRE